MKNLVSLICCLLFFYGHSQELSEAARDYYATPHFVFDKNVIAGSRIKQLEKHQYYYSGDSLTAHFMLEKHQFNNNGCPEYTYNKPVGCDKGEVYFSYDNDGNLIKKEIYGISNMLKHELIEWYDWAFRDGWLVEQTRYIKTDNIPTEKGASYFPEKFFLFSNDSILYNFADTSCIVLVNRREHCQSGEYAIYPASLERNISKELKFHANGVIRSVTTEVNANSHTNYYDQCGHMISGAESGTRCASRMANLKRCLSQGELRVCEASDTLTLDGQLVYVYKWQHSYFQHDSGPGTEIINEGVSYYSLDFQLIRSIDTRTSIRGNMFIDGLFTEHSVTRISTYEYFDNGLLRTVVTKNEQGELCERIEYQIEYF